MYYVLCVNFIRFVFIWLYIWPVSSVYWCFLQFVGLTGAQTLQGYRGLLAPCFTSTIDLLMNGHPFFSYTLIWIKNMIVATIYTILTLFDYQHNFKVTLLIMLVFRTSRNIIWDILQFIRNILRPIAEEILKGQSSSISSWAFRK